MAQKCLTVFFVIHSSQDLGWPNQGLGFHYDLLWLLNSIPDSHRQWFGWSASTLLSVNLSILNFHELTTVIPPFYDKAGLQGSGNLR